MSVLKNRIPSILIAASSFLAVRYLGANLLLPLSLISIALLTLNRLQVAAPLSVSLAFTIGHAAWFAVGGVLVPLLAGADLGSGAVYVVPDVVVMAAIVIWVYLRRSKVSIYALIAFQIVGGLVSVLKFEVADLAVPAVMYIHLGIRLVAVISAVLCLVGRHKPHARASAPVLELADQSQQGRH
jgi:hypothetical protein